LRVISYDVTSSTRLGDADTIARALPTVAWILARLRMIDASCTSRSTSPAVIAATLANVEAPERLPKRVPLAEHDRPAQADLEHAQRERLEHRDSSVVGVPQTSSWYRPRAVSPAPAQTQRGFPSWPMVTSLLTPPGRVIARR
jgi:hypothetical protein